MKKAQFTVAVAGALLSMFALSPSVHAEGKAVTAKSVKPGTFCTIQDAKACQEAVTPAQILSRFKAGNTRFVSGKPRHQNYLKEMKATAADQFPLASVVSCIDSRAPAEIVFDQGIGDLFNARVAGNIVNEDILGSLEFAHKVMGAKLLVVMGHTSCGAIKGACDDAQLGNLTGLIGKIKPAVNLVSADIKDRTSKNYAFVEMVAESNVHLTVEAIREKSPILREMEQKGEILIVGAMYDVKTGKVKFYGTPGASKAPGTKS
jgi:carbonic anhydrase